MLGVHRLWKSNVLLLETVPTATNVVPIGTRGGHLEALRCVKCSLRPAYERTAVVRQMLFTEALKRAAAVRQMLTKRRPCGASNALDELGSGWVKCSPNAS